MYINFELQHAHRELTISTRGVPENNFLQLCWRILQTFSLTVNYTGPHAAV